LRLTALVLLVLGLSTLSVALASCGGRAGGDCLVLPCPLPLAVTVKLTDASTGDPVNGATLHVSGAATAIISCNGLCYVPGTAGTYVLDISAPGFQSRQLTVVVQGTNPQCGCPTVVAQQLGIALSPSP
jgi:hypothetical protein